MSDKEKFAPKYWICMVCAELKGWKAPTWAVTVIMGKCGHCKDGKECTLTPTIDFETKDRKPIFD